MKNVVSLAEVGLASVAEAAKRIDRSEDEVRRLINAGRLPVVLAGGGMRTVQLLRIADLDAYEPAPRGRPVVTEPEKPAPKRRGRPAKKR